MAETFDIIIICKKCRSIDVEQNITFKPLGILYHCKNCGNIKEEK